MMITSLPEHLLELRDSNRKLLVPFITGGIECWSETLIALEQAGADAIEVGIPFSDAVMDGPIICEANDRALAAGTTPTSILKEVQSLKLSIPVIVMTYYNIAFHSGLTKFARKLKKANISGAILADLPYEASKDWIEATSKAEISPILLAAPTASDERLENIAKLSKGFIYAVGLLGVTGIREELADSAAQLAGRLKQVTDTPVLVGVGISTPKQAQLACEVADGVIVGSALVQTLMKERSPDAVGSLLGDFRVALDKQ